MTELTPREIVSELDRYIVGQNDAKRAVAVALRNRWRRKRVPADLRDESARVQLIVAVAGPDGVAIESRDLTGGLSRKRDTAAVFSLDVLRRVLNSA